MSLSKHLEVLGKTSRSFLRLLELNRIQNLLEFLARDKARQNGVDLRSAHRLGGIRAFGIAFQPEIAEIAQFHNIPSRQFLRDDGQQGFQHRHCIHAGNSGNLCNLPCQLAHGLASAGFDGRIEFLGRFRIGRIPALYDIEFHGHGSLLWL